MSPWRKSEWSLLPANCATRRQNTQRNHIDGGQTVPLIYRGEIPERQQTSSCCRKHEKPLLSPTNWDSWRMVTQNIQRKHDGGQTVTLIYIYKTQKGLYSSRAGKGGRRIMDRWWGHWYMGTSCSNRDSRYRGRQILSLDTMDWQNETITEDNGYRQKLAIEDSEHNEKTMHK